MTYKRMNTHNVYKTIQAAMETGREWGEQEVEAWRDQHDGDFSSAPPWTRGTYCGALPNDETRELIEAIIDIEAERMWDASVVDSRKGK